MTLLYLPLKGLTCAHIFCQIIAVDKTVKAFEPVAHRYRASRSIAFVSGPAAKACDCPRSPGESAGAVRVPLLIRAPLQLRLKRMQHFDFRFIEHAFGWRILAFGSTCQHQLHGDTRSNKRDHRELFQSAAILDDTLLDAQPL